MCRLVRVHIVVCVFEFISENDEKTVCTRATDD